MTNVKSKQLDRKKLFADPVTVFAIILVLAFLLLFVVYPLCTILAQSFTTDDTAYVNNLSKNGKALVTYAADDAEMQQNPVYRLGSAAVAYSKEYFARGKTNTDTMKALRAEMDGALAEIDADESLLAAYAAAVKSETPVAEEDVANLCSAIAHDYPEIGKVGLTLEGYFSIFASKKFLQVVRNTLMLGAISGLCSTVIGFLFAYVDVYVKTKLRGIFKVISMLPIVSPPFVLSLSMIMLFGKKGIITYHLLNIKNANIYGLHGILFVQILTFFPVTYLMLKGLLANIDPSLEESSRNMGASRWRVFKDITLPLLLPGIGNAFLVSFIESVADFTNPIMIGGDFDTLAAYIYMQISNFDTRSSSAMAVVLLTISMILFIIEKYFLERKSVATLTGKASRVRMQIEDRSVRIPTTALCAFVGLFVIGMYAMVPVGALFKLWGKDFSLTFKHFVNVLGRDTKPFTDSLYLSFVASIITSLLSMIIAYLIVKKKFFGRRFIEFATMFAMAVPGTVLGIAILRGFITGVFHSGVLVLVGTSTILIVAFVVRSLPIGTRSAVAALNQIDKSIEESAYDMGAGSIKVFTSITLPLISDSFFSSLVTTFARSITATSAVIFLISARWQLITPQIMHVVDRGQYSVACAYATIMMLIVYVAIFAMQLVVSRMSRSRRIKEQKV